jgi:hypothetical protein
MPSGFKSFGGEEFDRVFLKETEIIDRFVGERLWSWGANYIGVLGDNTTTARSSPGTTVGGGVNWASVSIALFNNTSFNQSTQAAGIKTDSTLWTWGDNYASSFIGGALGTGDKVNRSSPGTTVSNSQMWKQVSLASSAFGIAD